MGYSTDLTDYQWSLIEHIFTSKLGLFVDISERINPGFELLPKRWVVERTLAWANNSRRLSKDYEIRIKHSENMFMISHLHTLLNIIEDSF